MSLHLVDSDSLKQNIYYFFQITATVCLIVTCILCPGHWLKYWRGQPRQEKVPFMFIVSHSSSDSLSREDKMKEGV